MAGVFSITELPLHLYGAATEFDGPRAGALEHSQLEFHELVTPSRGRAGVVQWQNISFPS